MVKRLALMCVTVALMAAAGSAWAQVWRGTGRMAGRVTDEAGQPIEGVKVKMFLPSGNGGPEVVTNKKGDWAVGGINSGAWQVDFVKAGYETRRLTVDVEQLSPKPPMDIVMKKAAPDPNQIISAELKKAAGMVTEAVGTTDKEARAKKFADAQGVYADLLAKYPQAYQLELPIARAYHAEGAFDKEIEHLKKYHRERPLQR